MQVSLINVSLCFEVKGFISSLESLWVLNQQNLEKEKEKRKLQRKSKKIKKNTKKNRRRKKRRSCSADMKLWFRAQWWALVCGFCSDSQFATS